MATSPSGAISVAAVKLNTGDGVESAKITLAEDSGQGQDTAAIEACSTTNNWTPKSPGAWADAPPPDCREGHNVPLTRDATGQWTGDIAKLLTGSTSPQSVMIVPTPAASGVGNVPFQIAFKPPTVAGTTMSSGESDTSSSNYSNSYSSDTSSSPSYSSSSSSGTGTSGTGTSSLSGFSSSPLISVPSAGATESGAATAATASPPPSTSDNSSTGFKQFKASLGARAASAASHKATRGTAIGLFGLALLIGAIAAVASWANAEGYFEFSRLRALISR